MAVPVFKMLTANRLRDGDVLYWREDGWVLSLQEGQVFADAAAAEAALAQAQARVTENLYVAPYLFEVRVEKDGLHPVKEREIIRAAGPTVHKHTGKQAGQTHV